MPSARAYQNTTRAECRLGSARKLPDGLRSKCGAGEKRRNDQDGLETSAGNTDLSRHGRPAQMSRAPLVQVGGRASVWNSDSYLGLRDARCSNHRMNSSFYSRRPCLSLSLSDPFPRSKS